MRKKWACSVQRNQSSKINCLLSKSSKKHLFPIHFYLHTPNVKWKKQTKGLSSHSNVTYSCLRGVEKLKSWCNFKLSKNVILLFCSSKVCLMSMKSTVCDPWKLLTSQPHIIMKKYIYLLRFLFLFHTRLITSPLPRLYTNCWESASINFVYSLTCKTVMASALPILLVCWLLSHWSVFNRWFT